MSHEKNIDHMLAASQSRLSDFERAESWKSISNKLKDTAAVEPVAVVSSPYLRFLNSFHSRSFVPALLVVLCIGAGGTLAGAHTAKPGDALFPIERFTEQVRLSLATPKHAEVLRSQFAHERLTELEAILDEEATVPSSPHTLAFQREGYDSGVASMDVGSADSAPSAVGGGSPKIATRMAINAAPAMMMAKMEPVVEATQVEARVYRDITILQVWHEGAELQITTTARTGAAIADEVAKQLSTDAATVGTSITFVTEDRLSRPSERGSLIATSAGEGRVSAAVQAFLDDLEDVDPILRAELIEKMLSEIDGVGVERTPDHRHEPSGRIKIKDGRIELRDDGYRVRIKNEQYGKYGKEEVTEDQDGVAEPGSCGSGEVSPGIGAPAVFEKYDGEGLGSEDSFKER